MIVQGARDPNVSPKNMEVVRRKLDENRIKYDLLIFEDEGHGIFKRDSSKRLQTSSLKH
jgi:dipeptidyl aminopeptidase/acylaminoacyl peptidase